MNKIEKIKNYLFCIGVVILVGGYALYNLFSRELNERTGLESYTIGLMLFIGGAIVLGLALRIIVEALKSDSKKINHV